MKKIFLFIALSFTLSFMQGQTDSITVKDTNSIETVIGDNGETSPEVNEFDGSEDLEPIQEQTLENAVIDSLIADGELTFVEVLYLFENAPSIASKVGLKYWAYFLLVLVTVFIPGVLRRLNLTKVPVVDGFLSWLDDMQNKYLAPLLALGVSVFSLAFGGEAWGFQQVVSALPEVFAGTFTLQQVAYWGMKLIEWALNKLNIDFNLNGGGSPEPEPVPATTARNDKKS